MPGLFSSNKSLHANLDDNLHQEIFNREHLHRSYVLKLQQWIDSQTTKSQQVINTCTIIDRIAFPARTDVEIDSSPNLIRSIRIFSRSWYEKNKIVDSTNSPKFLIAKNTCKSIDILSLSTISSAALYQKEINQSRNGGKYYCTNLFISKSPISIKWNGTLVNEGSIFSARMLASNWSVIRNLGIRTHAISRNEFNLHPSIQE